MQPKCDVVSVSPVLLALTQEELSRSQIPVRIRGMFDIVYSWLRDAPVRQAGHNYALLRPMHSAELASPGWLPGVRAVR
jgi:hypothetical protein